MGVINYSSDPVRSRAKLSTGHRVVLSPVVLQSSRSPTFLAPGTIFVVFQGLGGGNGLGMVQEHYIIVHFISIIIASTPPQIIRH